jgi:hypothetical protein
VPILDCLVAARAWEKLTIVADGHANDIPARLNPTLARQQAILRPPRVVLTAQQMWLLIHPHTPSITNHIYRIILQQQLLSTDRDLKLQVNTDLVLNFDTDLLDLLPEPPVVLEFGNFSNVVVIGVDRDLVDELVASGVLDFEVEFFDDQSLLEFDILAAVGELSVGNDVLELMELIALTLLLEAADTGLVFIDIAAEAGFAGVDQTLQHIVDFKVWMGAELARLGLYGSTQVINDQTRVFAGV